MSVFIRDLNIVEDSADGFLPSVLLVVYKKQQDKIYIRFKSPNGKIMNAMFNQSEKTSTLWKHFPAKDY